MFGADPSCTAHANVWVDVATMRRGMPYARPSSRAVDPIHVALFCPTMGMGGAERMFRRLAVAFTQAGLRVDVVTASEGGANAEGLPTTVRAVNLGCRRMLTSVPSLVRYLNEATPDVLVSTLAHANIPAIWACGLVRKRPQLIVREANTLSMDCSESAFAFRNRFLPLLATLFYPRADAVVAVSRGVAKDLAENLRIPKSVIRVIHNPTVDDEVFRLLREPVRHPWFEDDGPPVLLSVGRLTAQKRFEVLVRAVSLVRQRRLVRLVILGEGGERERLESLVQELGLGDCVSLPGFDSNPYAYMARARLYVMSSAWEGFPNSVVEALACGLAVVSTDCPSGPREILDTNLLGTGSYGTLVPVDDPRELAEAILTELDVYRDRDQLRRRAQAFTSQRAARSYMDLMRTRRGL